MSFFEKFKAIPIEELKLTSVGISIGLIVFGAGLITTFYQIFVIPSFRDNKSVLEDHNKFLNSRIEQLDTDKKELREKLNDKAIERYSGG